MMSSCTPGLPATKVFVHVTSKYEMSVVQGLCGTQHIITVSVTVMRQILKTCRLDIQLKPVKILISDSEGFFFL